MKKWFIMTAILALPFASFAQPIQLKPGATVVLNGDVVSCQGPSEENLTPQCSIRQDGSYYRVYSGTTVVNSYWSFSEAVEGVKTLKTTGLCR
ncbi:MAG: hypothetical protein ACXVCY_01050 [Pseudobdellovibrionaceae bacterium]